MRQRYSGCLGFGIAVHLSVINVSRRLLDALYQGGRRTVGHAQVVVRPVSGGLGLVRASGDAHPIRWVGDFQVSDPVHVDDALNVRDPAAWQAAFAALHGAGKNPA